MRRNGGDGRRRQEMLRRFRTWRQVESELAGAACRVINCGPHVDNEAELEVLVAVIRAFRDDPEAVVVSRPVLARTARFEPDVVLRHGVHGIHVLEVKGYTLDQVESVDSGEFRLVAGVCPRSSSPFRQVRDAMFDIKNAAGAGGRGLRVPFNDWVVLPNIRRTAWVGRWGPAALDNERMLFAEDLDPPALRRRLAARAEEVLRSWDVHRVPAGDLARVEQAFGSTDALPVEPRRRRSVRPGSLGDWLDSLARVERALTPEQARLSQQEWRAPHLVRGVAGSGKTAVLLAHLVRRLRGWATEPALFDRGRRRRALLVCFNRTLAAHLAEQVRRVWERRGVGDFPEESLVVEHLNALAWGFSVDARRRGAGCLLPGSHPGLWRYVRTSDVPDPEGRAARYLAAMRQAGERLDALRFDAVYVDEAQDFVEDELRMLVELCRPDGDTGQRPVFLFYDDAQNLYAHPRPNWASVGLSVKGRTHVMAFCLRSVRQVIEPAFNVLLGTAERGRRGGGTRGFADVAYLENAGLLRREGGAWRIGFAPREGLGPPVVRGCADEAAERLAVARRVRELVEDEEVLPEDILVLGPEGRPLEGLVQVLERELEGLARVHDAFAWQHKDDPIRREGHVTVSTVHAAKGYDAFCVLFVSANHVPATPEGRALFYVACTRAREHLEVFHHGASELVDELVRFLERHAEAAPASGG